jgi:hypothetical protein
LTVLMSQVMILACIADVWRSLEAIADGFPPTRWLTPIGQVLAGPWLERVQPLHSRSECSNDDVITVMLCWIREAKCV